MKEEWHSKKFWQKLDAPGFWPKDQNFSLSVRLSEDLDKELAS